jgi:hypothetical protein
MSDTGAANFTGQLTLGSTITNGASTYTLPSSSGTLALTSAIPANPVGGTGTTNYLPKFTGASTIGNSAIQDDGTNVTILSRIVGINGATEAGWGLKAYDNLKVQNSNGTTILQLSDTSIGGKTWSLISSGTGNVHSVPNGTFYLRNSSDGLTTLQVTPSGNLGLGVTPSDWFVVYKALQIGSYGAAISGQTNDQALTLWSNAYPNASNVETYTTNNAAAKFRMESGAYKWFTAAAGTGAITFTQAMTLFSTGNLAIGTTTDAGYKLDVNGTGRFTGDVNITSTTGNSAFIKLNRLSTTNSSDILFSTNGTDDWFMGTNALGTNLTDFYIYRYGVGTAMSLAASTGAATFYSSVTATSFFESSDSRLKTLIQDNYQTKGIASITPKLYTKNGKVELGYYAQDFVGILDSAVSKGSDDMLSLSYREVLVAKVYALEQRIKELENK